MMLLARSRSIQLVKGLVVLLLAIPAFYYTYHMNRGQAPTSLLPREPPQGSKLVVKPQANGLAYSLYLRARELETHLNPQDMVAARDLYADAVAADPTLAQAHARYAIVLAILGQIDRATAEANEALRLEPDLGEGHFARAKVYEAQQNYLSAVPEVETAARNLPGDSEIIYDAASLHRRLGRWKQSLAEFERAVALDPRNVNGPTDLAYHLSLMRKWPEATAAWDRALAIVPESMFNKIVRSYVDFWSRGDVSRGKVLLESYPADYAGDFRDFLAWMRWDFNLVLHNYDAAAQAIDNIKEDPALGGFLGPITRGYMHACIELARGDREAALPLLNEACKSFEDLVKKTPGRAQPHARLAVGYALSGQKSEALAEAAKAQELCPESKDAFDGACISTAVAVVYTWTGETDRAIAELNRLLRQPGALNYDFSITLSDLKHRWLWDPLRSDARFQQIIAGPEPQTIIP